MYIHQPSPFSYKDAKLPDEKGLLSYSMSSRLIRKPLLQTSNQLQPSLKKKISKVSPTSHPPTRSYISTSLLSRFLDSRISYATPTSVRFSCTWYVYFHYIFSFSFLIKNRDPRYRIDIFFFFSYQRLN